MAQVFWVAANLNVGLNMDEIHLSALIGAEITTDTATAFGLSGGSSLGVSLGGVGFTYDANDQLSGGVINRLSFTNAQGAIVASGLSTSAAPLLGWVLTDATATAFSVMLSGADTIQADRHSLVRGYDGNDDLSSTGGDFTAFGGLGDDFLSAGAGSNYLRGDEGNDSVAGGAGFDDINGNMGADTAHGNNGDDWVVGGKDNDLLFGDAGADIVYGNLGADTCDGGEGNDLVRGGQGDDTLSGGNGADWMSGDRGNDTISGGAGADIFHSFSGAGLDRVTDFSVAQGDRIQLDAGTSYTVNQVGADTVIDMGAGDQLILVGVQASTLPAGSIFIL